MELQDLPVTPIKLSRAMRLLHRAFPLERRFLPLLDGYDEGPGLLSVPWGNFRLYFPSSWLADVGAAAYKGPRPNNPEFFQLLAPLVPKLGSGSIVDVGAAIGVYILNFRALTDAPIIAYEPSPLVFQLANYNVRSNRVSGVELKNAACGDTHGQIELRVGINSSIDLDQSSTAGELEIETGFEALCRRYRLGRGVVSVPLVRLDDELDFAKPVSLLKIDCEGFEYQILSGSTQILQKWRPYVFIELHPQHIGQYGHTISEVCELLAPSYDLEFWDYGRNERSANRAARVFGRYRLCGYRFPEQAAMLEAVAKPSKPSQMFLVGWPK